MLNFACHGDLTAKDIHQPSREVVVSVNIVNIRRLDSAPRRSYLAAIPFHRQPGGAFVRASVFGLEWA
jgi:hypothetical protein